MFIVVLSFIMEIVVMSIASIIDSQSLIFVETDCCL